MAMMLRNKPQPHNLVHPNRAKPAPLEYLLHAKRAPSSGSSMPNLRFDHLTVAQSTRGSRIREDLKFLRDKQAPRVSIKKKPRPFGPHLTGLRSRLRQVDRAC